MTKRSYFNTNIVHLREKNILNQAEVADKLKIHRPTYNNWEGTRGYSLITEKKLAIGYGLNIGAFVTKHFETLIGINSLKQINLGIRFSL